MKTVFIYALKDPRDGAVKYIGKTETPKRRLYIHVREAKKQKKQTYKNNWILSLISAGVSPEMEILDEVPDTQQNFFERAYIKVYRESGFKLTNGTDGGDGGATTTGRKLSPEQCAQISARNKGVPKTPEHRAALSAALMGVPHAEGRGHGQGRKPGFKHSEETKKLQSQLMLGKFVGEKNPMFGHTHTPEAIAKQKAAKEGTSRGEENPFFGRKHTDESKALMRASRLATIAKKREEKNV